MSLLSRDQQIQVIGCLTEGMSIRAIERLTGIHRDTIMRLGARVGRGCAELHDRVMVGLRVGRIEMDELWAFVGKKQRHLKRTDSTENDDQYTFIALASSSRAIIGYRTGKRNGEMTDQFVQDLRDRVIGAPEISTDGFQPYQPAIRDAFLSSAHGVINKTFSVTHLEAASDFARSRAHGRRCRYAKQTILESVHVAQWFKSTGPLLRYRLYAGVCTVKMRDLHHLKAVCWCGTTDEISNENQGIHSVPSMHMIAIPGILTFRL
jgi:IS1 family transposase